MPRVTLQTIADELGVSRTTVSNAFSRPDQLSPQLRDRIRSVADRLGYTGPDPVARSLRSGRTGVVGVLVREQLGFVLGDPYSRDFLTGVADVIAREEAGLLLIPTGEGATEAVRTAAVDGFVVFTLPDGHAAVDVLRARGLPTVAADGPQVDGVPLVAIDERSAAGEVARHVVGAGHERLLVLTLRLDDDGPFGVVDDARLAGGRYRVIRERLRGALDGLAAAGVDPASVEVVEIPLNQPALAVEAVTPRLTGPDRPTAVVALTDAFALGVLDAAGRLGLDVPADLSVTGFDDIAAAGEAGLTTVRQSGRDKGRLVAELVLAGATGEDVVMAHELIRRDTVGPAPRR